LALLASSLHWLARPHLFTFLGTAIFVAILDGWYSGRFSARRLWLLPLAMVVWANLHGGFLIGFALCLIYGIADLLRAAGAETSAAATHQRLRQLLPAVM